MILIDDREKTRPGSSGERPMAELFGGTGVAVETVRLESGDYAFEGNGPDGPLMVGIERKRIGDLINSCFSGRVADLQAPRMAAEYDRIYMMVEGKVNVNWQTNRLQKWRPNKDPLGGGSKGSWEDWEVGGRTITWSTLSRFLLDFNEFFGMHAHFTDSPARTVEEIVTLHNWWQTKWTKHTGVNQFYTPSVTSKGNRISLSSIRPGRVARVAKEVDDIGWETANAIEAEFETVEELILASEDRLLEVKGVGKKTAEQIWCWFREKE